MIHKNTSLQKGGDNLSNQKWSNCEIEYDQFCCSCCTKSLGLKIKKKMIVFKKLYNLVNTLNVNDDNKEKCYGVSTDYVRKLTDYFFIAIGEKESTNNSLRKLY